MINLIIVVVSFKGLVWKQIYKPSYSRWDL